MGRMGRRAFLKTLGLTAGAAATGAGIADWMVGLAAAQTGAALPSPSTSPATAPSRRMNIICMLSDDVGLGDIGCCGGDKFKTPRIDALAKEGLRFERCYSTPLCGPSRCQLLTGQYPFRTGLISNQSEAAISPQKQIMIPTIMKQAGYVTASVGKWGQMPLGPRQWGFDEYLTFLGSGKYWNTQGGYSVNGEAKTLAEGEYLPDVMHDFAVDFIRRNREKPFFLYYPMSHIHGPILKTPDSKPGGDLYAENIAYMDKLVGKLIDELDRLKLRENTLVIFVGDNGTAGTSERATVGGKPLSGAKASMREGGARVPMIVNCPGTVPAGKVIPDLIDFSDFLPTFAEIGAAPLPKDRALDGRSFVRQLRGQPGQPRTWIYVELSGRRYVRDDRWKYTGAGELYDLKDAPFTETLVPADSAEAPAVDARKRLHETLVALVGEGALGGEPGLERPPKPRQRPRPNRPNRRTPAPAAR